MSTVLRLFQLFAVDPASGPAYRQLASFVEGLIRSGLLAPGSRLPAERTVAATLGLSRTTVSAAFAELSGRGLVASRVGDGTFVVAGVSGLVVRPPPWAKPPAVPLEVLLNLAHEQPATGTETPPHDVISLAAGVPAPELMPPNLFVSVGSAPVHTPPEGLPELRGAIAEWVASGSGTNLSAKPAPEEILVTSGSQQALDLVGRAFVRPGDVVLVERPTYVGAIQLFKTLGAHLVELDLSSDHFTGAMARLGDLAPRLIYVQSAYHNPTGGVMSLSERQRVLRLARHLGVPVVEDDAYREIWLDVPPPPSFRELAPECGDPLIITVGTISKVLTPALRVGWIWAPRRVLTLLARLKQVSDLHTSPLTQSLALQYLISDELHEHLTRLRAVYRQRRNRMVAALDRYLPQSRYERPLGGFYVWCHMEGIDSLSLLQVALRHGVAFLPGSSCHARGDGSSWLRLS